MLKQLKLTLRLKSLREQLTAFEEKRDGFKRREDELTKALDEAQTDEDIALVGGQIEELEKESKEADCDGNIENLKNQIADTEKELEDIGKEPEPTGSNGNKERNDNVMTETRGRFAALTPERRSAVLEDSGVREFLTRVREFKTQQRSVTGTDLMIPETILPMIKEATAEYSKLISKINKIPVSGTTRRMVAGAIPEAIWTEMASSISELSLDFKAIETDGFKVSGYFAVDNYILEDNDANLLSLLIEYLGAAIGYSIDKAIIYGTGTKMPLGIITRLAQTAQPSDYPSKAPAWTDLHTSHVLKLSLTTKTDAQFFAGLMDAFKVPDKKYNGADNRMFWVMNRKTHMDLIAKTIEFNSAAALVAQQNNTMPIIGGDIVELDFMADNDIAGGFGAMYNLMERHGSTVSQSEHVKFLEDQTVIKGTARYDGKPVYAEGFVLFNYANTAPTTSAAFAGQSNAAPSTPSQGGGTGSN